MKYLAYGIIYVTIGFFLGVLTRAFFEEPVLALILLWVLSFIWSLLYVTGVFEYKSTF